MSEKLSELVKRGESEEVEFKKSTAQLDRALKSVCSFLNHKGGMVYFGISKDKIVGQEVSEQTLKSISQKIRQRIKPEISPEIKVLEIEEKSIIEVIISEGRNKPYFLDGVCYKRVGTENIIISPEELERIILEKRKRYWDSDICEEASLEDIDEEKVRKYIEKRGIEKPKEMNLDNFLVSVRAVNNKRGNKPTNGGLLFFGKNPQRFFLPARIHCVKFDGNEISRNTIDESMCDGTLWEMLNNAESFVNKNVRLYGFRTEVSFRRIEKLEYPLRAIREAIVNALIHREYSEPSEIKLFMFNNRLEIINSGSFPEGVTPQNPIHKPRNPLLCEYMKDIHYIEKYGSGIYMMRKLCGEWGIPEPEYVLDRYWTKIIFRLSKAGILLSEIMKHGIELNNRQINAVKYVFEHNSITNEEYQKINNIKRTTSKIELKKLVEKGLFEVRGKGKGTRYVLSMTIR
jgi:ATP-dependent DNA helicase RecG